MYKAFIFFCLFFNFSFTQAHETKVIIENYNNVKVVFITGFYYEEINNALIAGQYAERLSNHLNFNFHITLMFKHGYTKNYTREYKIKPYYDNKATLLKIFGQ